MPRILRLLGRLWPRSLATRTALILLAGLAVVQAAGLFINALDRIDLQRLAQERALGLRIMSAYHAVAASTPEDRAAVLRDLDTAGTTVSLGFPTDFEELPPAPPPLQQVIRLSMRLVPLPPSLRPLRVQIHGAPWLHQVAVALQLPDSRWMSVRVQVPPPRLFLSPTFLAAFTLMSVVAAVLTVWAVRRLTEPVRTLAGAAEALGRDVNATPLAEDGPSEVAKAAAAFNTMAARIRRFVQDRTFLLTAIGHDLRTPITRLKLRAEFIEDDELRRKFLADLDELEAMVSATLAFGRDASSREPMAALDLGTMVRTVLDDAADARPEMADRLVCEAAPHVVIKARPVALKRALANLVGNAVLYGGGARVAVGPPGDGQVCLSVEDDGPGIPPEELERVFEPFFRVEASRNRETGGTGLGLPIARNILRAHGGDVVLANRAGGGVRATVTLPL